MSGTQTPSELPGEVRPSSILQGRLPRIADRVRVTIVSTRPPPLPSLHPQLLRFPQLRNHNHV